MLGGFRRHDFRGRASRNISTGLADAFAAMLGAQAHAVIADVEN